MTSMQQEQQLHRVVAPSLSLLNNPKTMQTNGGITPTNAFGAPGVVLSAPISLSPVHCRHSALNSSSTSSSLSIAHQLQSVSTDTTATIMSFTTYPPQIHGASPQGAPHSVYPHSLVNHTVGRTLTPPQHQHQHARSLGASSVAPESLVSLTAAPLALPSLGAPTTPTKATTTILSTLVDLDLRRAHERPFRFKMLPPPPPFERFVVFWETNAPDQTSPRDTTRGTDLRAKNITYPHDQQMQQQDIARANDHSIGGAGPQTERGNTEATLRASPRALAEPCQLASDWGSLSGADEGDVASGNAVQNNTAAPIRELDKGRIIDELRHSTPDRLAMLSQYQHILERWWLCMVTLENKPEVRQQIGDVRPCPSFADAQKVVAAAAPIAASPPESECGTPPSDPTDTQETDVLTGTEASAVSPTLAMTADPLLTEEAVLQTWSRLVVQWWEETKQRRRPRCSCPRAPHLETLPLRTNGDDVDGRRAGIETQDAASLASVNSYELPSNEEAHLSGSPLSCDHDTLLHFDFTCHSALSSPTDSLQV
ncbi:hypothetical protein JKF63_06102 [Porcisia hertigi]|uniref:Uncharacterized protein n=1 Tax=Porcisia hertigi TaxID=2761500 RepID=A0A836IGJ4_9TRYP|nr:hypothetical protein JKF63_06102 [Porcisia hertigi]